MVFNNFNKFQLEMSYKAEALKTDSAFDKQLQDITKALTELND